MNTPHPGVSLSGATRLTYRQAVALLHAAFLGDADLDPLMDTNEGNACAIRPSLAQAICKLKRAIDLAGGYDAAGNLDDPFDTLEDR